MAMDLKHFYLLDILMPHMKGIELARRIRERGEPAELIFLTISSVGMTNSGVPILPGATSYSSKTITS